MLKRLIIFTAFVCLFFTAKSQQSDTALISQLISDIQSAQATEASREYCPGMFPAYRECGGIPHNYKADNNIFFTAVGVVALKNMLPYLNDSNRLKVITIIEKAVKAYPKFQSRYGQPFYNFWGTNDVIMPHSYVFKYMKSIFGQSEDADDSVMILLGEDNNDSMCAVLKKRLIQASNLSEKKIIATYRKYKNIPAYSTWLGARMPVDFDFGVHCNVLYFVMEKKLPLVKQDSATITLLAKMIAAREYVKAPVYLSPYYVRTPVLLYHLARLMGKFKIPQLEPYKPQIVADIKQQLTVCYNVMDQIILRTALLRLSGAAPLLDLENIKEFEQSNQRNFVFFQARAAFSYPTPFKQIFLHWSYVYYYFYSPAYNKILWLEFLVEKQRYLAMQQ